MKIKLSNILIAIALTIFSCLFGLKYNKFGTNKNTETYLGLPVYTAFNSKIYDTSTIFNAIKYSDYAFIARVNFLKTTEYKYDDKLPYTIYDISVIKNISGELIYSNNIELIQYGGINYDEKSYIFAKNERYLNEGHYYFFTTQTWGLKEGEGIIFEKAIDLGETLEQSEVEEYSINNTLNEDTSFNNNSSSVEYKKTISKYDVRYNNNWQFRYRRKMII